MKKRSTYEYTDFEEEPARPPQKARSASPPTSRRDGTRFRSPSPRRPGDGAARSPGSPALARRARCARWAVPWSPRDSLKAASRPRMRSPRHGILRPGSLLQALPGTK